MRRTRRYSRQPRQTESDILFNLLVFIIIFIGFIILLAKALIVPVFLSSVILLVVGYYVGNWKILLIGALGLFSTLILFMIAYSFGESEIGKLSQDAFRGFYNATAALKFK